MPVYQMSVLSLEQVARTFTEVFPAAAAYYGGGDLILVGTIAEALPEPRTFDGPVGEALAKLGASDLAALRVAGGPALRFVGGGKAAVLRDADLRLEFGLPRYADYRELADCFAWVRRLWGAPPRPYDQVLLAQEADARGTESRAHLDRALHENPEHPFVRRFAGEACLGEAEKHVRLRQLDEARRNLRKARGLLGDDPRLTGVEADLREEEGDEAGAARLLRELLALSPDSAYLKRRIERLEAGTR
jgi:hypothetical protein